MPKRLRDENFDECVATAKAFLRGGPYGVYLLNRVSKNLLRHYNVADFRSVVQAAGGVWKYGKAYVEEED